MGSKNLKTSLEKQENIIFPFKLSVIRTYVGNFFRNLSNALKCDTRLNCILFEMFYLARVDRGSVLLNRKSNPFKSSTLKRILKCVFVQSCIRKHLLFCNVVVRKYEHYYKLSINCSPSRLQFK